MLLPETKEREYRFRLALRIGLPIFALILAFVSNTLITSYESLQATFYFESVILLAFSIFFIFYLIYNGFDERITEHASKTFTKEYLYKYLKKKIKSNKQYTLILISIDNLHDINTRYGIKKGDDVLYNTVKYINRFFKNKKITNFPMGHIKSGDFVIGLNGNKEEFNTILELLFLKSSDFKVDDIEVNISGTITDTSFSDNIDHMIENLFEIQDENKNKKTIKNIDKISPNDLELYVIDAIKTKRVDIMTQDVFQNNSLVLKEYFVKLKNKNNKVLYPKSYMKVVNKLGLNVDYDFLILQKSVLNYIGNTNIMFSINISPTSIRNYSFQQKVKELLNDNTKVRDNIIFILCESEYYSYTEKFNSILASYKKMGIKIAIDRLGSLHTSFLYLKELDIDIVRFDSSYIKDINKQKNISILNGFNEMAHNCGIKTWVKMVENQEIKNFVQENKFDYIQGRELAKLEKIYED